MPMLWLRVTGAAGGRQVAPSLSITKRFRFLYLHRAVAVDTPAGGLAGGVAYPAADGAEGIGGGDRLEGALVVLVPDVGDVGRRISADRTGDLARGGDVVDVAGVVLVLRRRVGHQDAVDVVDRQRSGVYPVWGRNCGGLRPGVSAVGGFNPERSPMRPQPWCHVASNMALASARTGSRGSVRRAAWFGAINTVRQAVTSGPGVARITLERLRSVSSPST